MQGSFPVTQVIILRWMDAVLIKNHIEHVVTTELKIIVDSRSNALVVSGPGKQISRVLSLVEYLDDKRWYNPPVKPKK